MKAGTFIEAVIQRYLVGSLVPLEAAYECCRILRVVLLAVLAAEALCPLVAQPLEHLVDGQHEEEQRGHQQGHANHCWQMSVIVKMSFCVNNDAWKATAGAIAPV